MIDFVYEQSASEGITLKFEVGTPNMAGELSGAAIDYLEELGMDQVEAHEQELLPMCFKITGYRRLRPSMAPRLSPTF